MRVRFLIALATTAVVVLVGPVVATSTPAAGIIDNAPGRLHFGAQLLALAVLLRAAILATATQDPRRAAQERRRRLVGPAALLYAGATFAFLGVLELDPALAGVIAGCGFAVVALSIRALDRYADRAARHHGARDPAR